MSTNPIDYQARNFKCYTVHESNSEDDNGVDGDEEENAMMLSSCGSSSSSTLAPSSSVEEWSAVPATPSWGYFVPLQPYCYLSPPVRRRRYDFQVD